MQYEIECKQDEIECKQDEIMAWRSSQNRIKVCITVVQCVDMGVRGNEEKVGLPRVRRGQSGAGGEEHD